MKEEIFTNLAPKPIGPYSQAIRIGDFIFLSGQIPINPETGEIIKGDIETQTEQVMSNVKAVLKEAGMDFSNVIKTTIYLTDLQHFSKVNEIYERYVEKPYPARSTVEVKGLPKGALVEIEVIACEKK
jgi:2-iminobutanoate/2-iminopropanoate deaminase